MWGRLARCANTLAVLLPLAFANGARAYDFPASDDCRKASYDDWQKDLIFVSQRHFELSQNQEPSDPIPPGNWNWRDRPDCQERILRDPVLSSCMKNIMWGQSKLVPLSYAIPGMTLSQYDQAVDLPPEIKAIWPNPEKLKSLCQSKGWSCLVYESAIVTNRALDPETQRIQVRIPSPDGKSLKVFAINFGKPNSRALIKVDMGFKTIEQVRASPPVLDELVGSMYVGLKDNQGKELEHPIFTMTDLHVELKTGQSTVKHNSQVCYDCHIAPMKKTEVKPGTAHNWETLKSFNQQALEITRKAKPIEPERMPEMPHFGRRSTCVSCHKANGIRPLDHWSFERAKDKMTEQLRMPPPDAMMTELLDRRDRGEKLGSADQKRIDDLKRANTALYKQLYLDYFSDLRSWQRQTPCTPPTGTTGSANATPPKPGN